MTTSLLIIDIVLVGVFLYYSFRRNIRLQTSNSVAFITFMGLIAALSLIFWQENVLLESQNRLKWPTITAVIIESKVIGDRALRPDIIYEYEVNGQTYQGDTNLNTPGFGGRRSRRDTAERIISEYEKGQKVLIYYNPNDPAESYIRPGVQWSDYMKSAVGHILFIFALFGFTGNIIQRVFLNKIKN